MNKEKKIRMDSVRINGLKPKAFGATVSENGEIRFPSPGLWEKIMRWICRLFKIRRQGIYDTLTIDYDYIPRG